MNRDDDFNFLSPSNMRIAFLEAGASAILIVIICIIAWILKN